MNIRSVALVSGVSLVLGISAGLSPAAAAVAQSEVSVVASGVGSAEGPGPTQPPLGTARSDVPGPASGPATIVPKASVAHSGQQLAVPRIAAVEPVDLTALAPIGTLTSPAAPPSADGWITSEAWNISPAPGVATPVMPVFARDVALSQPVSSATLSIAGLGLYTPEVNGRPASSAVLQPGYSDTAKSVEYRTYDVSGLLGTGTNRLAVQLGTGVYDEVDLPTRYSKLTHIGGPLGFTARLDVRSADGTEVSFDTSSDWLARAGGTTVADWFGGEDYDAGLLDPSWKLPTVPLDAPWQPAVVANISPGIVLYGQSAPAVTARTPVPAASVTRLSTGDWVVDFGRYVTGQPQLRMTAPAGRMLRMYPAERVVNGVPDQSTATGSKSRPIYDQYTFAGTESETWHPQFVYHGFRYLKVTGMGDRTLSVAMFSAIPVMADLARTGTFASSDTALNAIVGLTDASIDANLMSVPTDCPNREKLGWTEEWHLLFGLLSQRYDLSAYGPNLVRVMLEAQRIDGSMPEISPEFVRWNAPYDGDVNWGGALVQMPWQLYRTYGDRDTLQGAYDGMTRYVAYVRSRSTGHLIDFGLGDWITPAAGARRGATVSMGYYAIVATMAQAATALGETADAASYTTLAAHIRTAINAAYARDGVYGSEQATNAMALVLGLAENPTRVRGHLLSLLAWKGNHFDTGEIGLGYIVTALSDMGRDDLVLTAISQREAPGFASFVASGAPALPEYWNGMSGNGSLAHFMLGYPSQWAIQGLAGIMQKPTSVGFDDLLLRPAVYAGPASAQATLPTPQGTVSVSWTRRGSTARVTVIVPTGAKGSVVLPDGPHDVTAGTTSFSTTFGPLPTYGAVSFASPTGPITKVPWTGQLWGSVNATQQPITDAQWQSTGFRAVSPGLPRGSVVAFAVLGPQVYARTPDALIHALTRAEWAALGSPAPVRPAWLVSRYTWGPTVWVTTKWTPAASTWTVARLSDSDWVSLGRPPKVDSVVTPRSSVYRYSGGAVIYLKDPDGRVHALTSAEWVHLGRPTPTVVAPRRVSSRQS